MGVMSCSRNNCANVMCHNYSKEYGYICSDCLEELSHKGVTTNIENFMNSKKTGVDHVERAHKYFESIFSDF